ncbi:YgiW/YdeI family stress tolerance OB fold protein [Neisseriaceae bacterium CLB008]|nr:NirD/YgiW/YdeI family stress tolerance protein [Neisseriaceae bacterium]
MRTLAILTALALTSTAAFAQYTGPSNLAGDQVTTVKQILANGKDDQYVTVKGKIIRQVRKEHYVFSDGTGQLNIELDQKYLPVGQTFNDKTTVVLSGELEKDWHQPIELDVKHMRIM